MRLLNAIRMISAEIKHRVVIHHQLSHFTCGDCEEGKRCGRLPSDDCIERAVQTKEPVICLSFRARSPRRARRCVSGTASPP